VAAAVAFDAARGDRIEVVAAAPDVPAPAEALPIVGEALSAPQEAAPAVDALAPSAPAMPAEPRFPAQALILGGGILLMILILLFVAMRPRRQNLSVREREALAAQLKAWLDEAGAVR
jgi:flagellar biosynthesis/type III secretory pathway M-ring protein FliF/YscJ